MIEYDKLKELVDACSNDVAKTDKGNRSAGTRVRQVMQEVKQQAQKVREAILKLRDT
jgi:hypothetical protein